MTPAVLSLQTGDAGVLPWRGRQVRTGIFKTPVDGPVALTTEGFAGDVVVDRRYHGGPDKAVNVIASEHAAALAEELDLELPPGAFGENLTLRGLLDADAHIGDTYTLGTAVVQVSQPRGPCFKLAARHGRRKLVAAMGETGRTGWYLRVLEPGTVAAGDALALTARTSGVSVAEVVRVTYVDRDDAAAIERVLAVPELAAAWRDALTRRAA